MRNDFHPCSFAPPAVWARLLIANGGVPQAYWGKLAKILTLSALAAPLRLAETLLYSAKTAGTTIAGPPLFILGFARSGTTHLQNLMTRDPRYGYFTTFQGLVPTFSLMGKGWLQRLIEKGMADMGEQTRPMDNVKIAMSTPQEEDMGLANTDCTSFVHQLSFPGRTRELFEKYVIMGESAAGEPCARLTPEELRRWERAYLRIVRKASLHAEGKPLLLRNTPNVGRVDNLLRLFPGAKFVHIVRNPYDVYPSLLHLYRTLLPLYCLDDYDQAEMESLLVEIYRRTMTKYLRDREAIPDGHLAEVRYEDLERDPLGELERIYAALDLPGWETAKPHIDAYLQTLSGYRKNKFQPDRAVLERVSGEWAFALDAWGYAPPGRPS